MTLIGSEFNQVKCQNNKVEDPTTQETDKEEELIDFDSIGVPKLAKLFTSEKSTGILNQAGLN